MAGIVVGIDGSTCSQEALRFAAGEARLRGEPLHIVSVWHTPTATYIGASFIPELGDDSYKAPAREAAAQEVSEVLGPEAAANAEVVLRRGNAAEELIAASAGASMLVVGSRGRGGFKSLMLGSVSQQCAAHAECPVVIVHEPA